MEIESGNQKPVAFVTAYIKIYEDNAAESSRHRNLEWRMELFYSLASTGLKLFLFCSPEFEYLFRNPEFETKYPNVTLVQVLNIEDTWTWKTVGEVAAKNGMEELELPEHRNFVKDNKKYLVLQNAKVEFVKTVTELYPEYDHYSWIDFSIVSILKERANSLEYMRLCYDEFPNFSSKRQRQETPQKRYFFLPGCWHQQWFEPDKDALSKRIHWRFCGGFFIADRDSMLRFTKAFTKELPNYLDQFKVLTWEVNFWAWLEVVHSVLEPEDADRWKPTWFQADHNDSMVRTPLWGIATPLLTYTPHAHLEDLTLGANLSQEDHPKPDTEFLGSCSFTDTQTHGKILNTRIVNYWMYPNGYYRFHSEDRILRTRNLFSLIDANGQPTETYPILEDLGESVTRRHNPKAFSQGLEDVRIWTIPPSETCEKEQIRFIATNVNCSPTGNGRMVIGDLNLYSISETDAWTPKMENAVNVFPPRDSYIEKNWIPILLPDSENKLQEHFIYQWSPFQLGTLVTHSPKENDPYPETQLKIIREMPSSNPFFFGKIRGSSCFVTYPGQKEDSNSKDDSNGKNNDANDGEPKWLGVVHLSEEDAPRRYYHSLVTLDKNGLPLRYTPPFQFCKQGIEFCTGLECIQTQKVGEVGETETETETETSIRFWISRHDRDPAILTVPFDIFTFPFQYNESHPRNGNENGNANIQIQSETHSIKESDMQPTPIHIYVLCFNEELLLPHTVQHYRQYLPHAHITVYDNESTDRSVEIAKELGCAVVSWNSQNIQNEYIQKDMRNNIWKKGPETGWKLMIDMDEWLCVTEDQLREEEEKGVTILRVKGVNVMGTSTCPNLTDVTHEDLESIPKVVDWSQESKNLCFLTPHVKEMNYTHGAHACNPKGARIRFSEKTYYNKHMENLGLPFFIQKFTRRAERNRVMHDHKINLHYTDDIKKITTRYEELMGQAYEVESFERF
jgi:hypothetical protein